MEGARPTFTPLQRRRLVSLAVAATAIFVLLGALVHTDLVLSIDREVQQLIQAERTKAYEQAMRLVTHLGSGWVLLPVTAVVCLALAPRDRRLAATFVVTALSAVLLHNLVKVLVERGRPGSDHWGYPSGHVLGTAAFCGMVVYGLWALGASRRQCAAVAAAATVAVAGVALSRLWVNAHWLSDVVGGFAGGMALVLTIAIALDSRGRAASL